MLAAFKRLKASLVDSGSPKLASARFLGIGYREKQRERERESERESDISLVNDVLGGSPVKEDLL